MNIKVSFSLIAVILMLGVSEVAHADRACRHVKLQVLNEFRKDIGVDLGDGKSNVVIKVKKVNYYDKEDQKWRDNNLKNTIIEYGQRKTITETLEYVRGENIEKIQFKFDYYDFVKGLWFSAGWSKVYYFASETKLCENNSKYSPKIDGTGPKAN